MRKFLEVGLSLTVKLRYGVSVLVSTKITLEDYAIGIIGKGNRTPAFVGAHFSSCKRIERMKTP